MGATGKRCEKRGGSKGKIGVAPQNTLLIMGACDRPEKKNRWSSKDKRGGGREKKEFAYQRGALGGTLKTMEIRSKRSTKCRISGFWRGEETSKRGEEVVEGKTNLGTTQGKTSKSLQRVQPASRKKTKKKNRRGGEAEPRTARPWVSKTFEEGDLEKNKKKKKTRKEKRKNRN